MNETTDKEDSLELSAEAEPESIPLPKVSPIVPDEPVAAAAAPPPTETIPPPTDNTPPVTVPPTTTIVPITEIRLNLLRQMLHLNCSLA